MTPPNFSPDAFGDRFDLDQLPLARPAAGYAVQMLGTDTLLDSQTGCFLPVRAARLRGLFPSFDDAFKAAASWVESTGRHTDEHPLAIVPASFDSVLERHVLIYGVLTDQG